MRSSERSIRLGCSASKRARIASTWVISRSRRPGRSRRYRQRGARAWCRLGQQAAEFCECRTQLVPMHDHVDHAVIPKILRLLEPLRELLSDGLFDHPRTGKSDERTRLGNMHITKHPVRRRHPTRRRIGQDNDIGLSRLPQLLHADCRAGQLHQGEDALLHPRPTRSREQYKRRPFVDGGLKPLDHSFTSRHSKRAPHEVKILNCNDEWISFQLAKTKLYRVIQTGFGARVLETLRITTLIAEF